MDEEVLSMKVNSEISLTKSKHSMLGQKPTETTSEGNELELRVLFYLYR